MLKSSFLFICALGFLPHLSLGAAELDKATGTVVEKRGESLEELFGIDVKGELDKDGSSKLRRVQRRKHYPNGNVQEIQSLSLDESQQFVPHGIEVQFDSEGQLKSRGFMVKGQRSGKWIFVEANGSISQGEYQGGLKSGAWKTWTADKKLLVSEQFFANQLHGTRHTYHENGKIASKAFYNNGVKVGSEVFWYTNGKKAREVNWVDGVQHGLITQWSPLGRTLLKGQYFMGVPNKTWEWFDEEGTWLKSSEFTEGTGVFYDFAFVQGTEEEGRTLALITERSYQEGRLHGAEIRYFPDGSLRSEIHFRNGKKEGKFKEWYDNGALYREGVFKNDLPIGVVKEYHPYTEGESSQKALIAKEINYASDQNKATVSEFTTEGGKQLTMELVAGKPNGLFQAFYPDGTLLRSGVFEDGVKVKEWREYHPSGQLHTVQEYVLNREQGLHETWYEVEEGKEARIKAKGQFILGQRHGDWETWYYNGSVESKVSFIGGLEHGAYQEWWPNLEEEEDEQSRRRRGREKEGSEKIGKMKVKGSFVLGEKDGEWQVWHANNLLKSKAVFSNGIQDGIAEEYYDYLVDGKPALKLVGEYLSGEQTGKWEAYFNDGTVELTQYYKNGKMSGILQQFYATGFLKGQANFIDGVQDGEALNYHPNENLSSKVYYFNGRKHGPYIAYHENGKMAVRGAYHLDLPVDLWQWYNENGKDVLVSSMFDEGSGTMYEFYANGQKKSETEFVNGIENGKQVRWFTEGGIRSETMFHKGLVHGTFREYHENGYLLSESTWIYGRRNGTYLSWYGNEQQQMSLFFVDDAPHGQSTEWHENGEIKSSGSWVQGSRNGEWDWFDRYGEIVLEQEYDIGILLEEKGELPEEEIPEENSEE